MANTLELVVHGDDQASKVLEGIQGKIQGMSAGLKKAGIPMTAAGTAIVGSMALSVKSFAEAGDEVQKMAIKTGFSTEALSEWRYMAELGGTSLDAVEKGIKKMASTLEDAKDGLSTTTLAFDKLGVNVDDLKGKSPEETFNILTEAIANIEDPLERSALAGDIFGRAGTDLLPILDQGIEAMAAQRQETHALGLAFDQEAAIKAAAFNDSLTTLKGGLEGVKMMIAENVIPILMPLIDKVKEIISRVKEWIDNNPELFRVILIVVGGLGALMMILGPLLMILPGLVTGIGLVGGAFSLLMGPVGLIIAIIAALIAIGVLVWKNWDTIKERAIIIFTAVSDFLVGIWDNIKEVFASGINWIIDKINGLIEKINLVPGINIGTIGRIGEAPEGVPGFQQGGLVGSTGLAYLHKGETVIPANTTINVPIYLDGELITEKIVRRVGDMARLQGY